MAIPQRISDYLDSQNVDYEVLPHPQAFTGQEVAHTLHVSGKRLAKAVVMEADGKFVLAVIPGAHRVSLPDLKAALEVRNLRMLSEPEIAQVFPDCELGAVPPFGNLYAMDVWVDRTVSQYEDLVLCAGTHVDCIRMKYSDFARLTKPRLGLFSEVWSDKAA